MSDVSLNDVLNACANSDGKNALSILYDVDKEACISHVTDIIANALLAITDLAEKLKYPLACWLSSLIIHSCDTPDEYRNVIKEKMKKLVKYDVTNDTVDLSEVHLAAYHIISLGSLVKGEYDTNTKRSNSNDDT